LSAVFAASTVGEPEELRLVRGCAAAGNARERLKS